MTKDVIALTPKMPDTRSLLAGLFAGQSFETELFGDESLSGRPMGRITDPLGQMGAKIDCLGAKPGYAPLKIHGTKLNPIRYELPMASAQVKSAVLLAGMFCEGTTTAVQPAETRDHTERMLESFGVKLSTDGNAISIGAWSAPLITNVLQNVADEAGVPWVRLPDGVRLSRRGASEIWMNFNEWESQLPDGSTMAPVSFQIRG